MVSIEIDCWYSYHSCSRLVVDQDLPYPIPIVSSLLSRRRSQTGG